MSRTLLEAKLKLSSKGGTLSDRLNDLEEAGFIISFLSIDKKGRGVYYKVVDEYSLFYLRWIVPEKRSLLKLEKKPQHWQAQFNTAAWYSWTGYAFENICYKHMAQIRQALSIPAGSTAGVWRQTMVKNKTDGVQIDLLFERPDEVVTICEIKFTVKPIIVNKALADELLRKSAVFAKATATTKTILIALVSANGVKKSYYADDILSGVVTMEGLFVRQS